MSYTKLDTSIPKLQNQVKNMKADLRKISAKVRVGRGLAPQNKPNVC